MKLPLKIVDTQHIVNAETIYIADAGAAIVCSLPIEQRELAELIVREANRPPSLWVRLFGLPRDEKQRKYDKWIWRRSEPWEGMYDEIKTS